MNEALSLNGWLIIHNPEIQYRYSSTARGTMILYLPRATSAPQARTVQYRTLASNAPTSRLSTPNTPPPSAAPGRRPRNSYRYCNPSMLLQGADN